jgi:Ca2+-binding RTX toxin-like protein
MQYQNNSQPLGKRWHKPVTGHLCGRLLGLLASVFYVTDAYAQESLCAEVKIEIQQELTLERQGFEAIMRITNSLDTFALEDINVTVNFTDDDGNTVTATSNTSSSSAEFFINVDDSHNVSSVQTGGDGQITNGVIASASAGEIRWLIIPTANAAGQTENGELFFVGATLSYTYGGEQETIEVAPDSIVVKPQPALTLDYFLTEEVVGDDAFTPAVEPAEPYTLGLRITNSGYGHAGAVKIESAQPTIVENEQGLAVDFTITGSFLEDQPSSPSLLMDFGDIGSQEAKVGRWIMETSVSGKFTEFDASFTHADELGGELTSLLQATNAHLLVKDVKMDLAGRDGVKDFLAFDQTNNLFVFESETTGNDEPLCSDCISVTALSGSLSAEQNSSRSLTLASGAAVGYVKLADPYAGSKVLTKVVRDDGKVLDKANAWTSKSRADDKINFDYFINVFDTNAAGSYTLFFGDAADIPQAPVIQAITDRVTYEGGDLGFLVQSSDPNQTVPSLSIKQQPTGASFSDEGAGTGVFRWQPQVGQAGDYPVTFIASDGSLTAERHVNITVNPAADKDGDGLDDDWEQQYFGSLDRDGSGDFDGDGRSDSNEHDNNTDPTVAEVAPAAPQVVSPIFDAEIMDGSPAPWLPLLSVSNGAHAGNIPVVMVFEVFSDDAMSELVASVQVAEGTNTTSVQLDAAHLATGQSFNDNSLYYWRARARTDEATPVASEWVNSRFFINSTNDAPGAPQLSSPAQDAIVAELRPTLVVNNAIDLDRDLLSYRFDVFAESDLATPLLSVNGLLPGGNGTTEWQVGNNLQEDAAYAWVVTVKDERGLETPSAVGAFLVSTSNDKPQAPALYSPAQQGVVTQLGSNGELNLQVVNGTDPEQQSLTYRFEFDSVNTFDSVAKQVSGSLNEDASGYTSWQVSGLQENQTYYWRVKANDGVIDSDWVQGEFFVNTVNEAPVVPTLANPGQDAVILTLQPLLQVNPVIDPDGDSVQYRFEVYRDVALTDLVAQQLVSDSQWGLGFDLDDNSHYYWRAQAEDSQGLSSDWSAVSHFMVNENGINDAPTFSFVLPDTNISVGAPTVLLQWVDSDPDSAALISLFYRYEGGGAVLIADNISEDAEGVDDQYAWDVSALLPGNYTVFAEINDGDNTVIASACCTVTVPVTEKTVSVTPQNGLATEESGVTDIKVDVVLDHPLAANTSLTLNLSISDGSEGVIVGNSYLVFTPDNWNQTQTVTLRGVDDCEIDGEQPFNLVFQPAVSDDEAYNGYSLDSITLTNSDNEQQGQTLFVCDYTLVSQVDAGNGESDFTYKAHLLNTGASLQSATASLSLLASADANYSVSLISGGVSFSDILSGSSVQSDNTFTLRYAPGQVLDKAKLQWNLTPGAISNALEGTSANNTLTGTDADDLIDGKAGNDTLYGGAGNDTLIGGVGADYLYGEAGDDTFVVEGNDAYADRFNGGDGFDTLRGGAGDDAFRISSFSGANTVERVDGQSGRNIIWGTSANNTLNFSDTELLNIEYIDALAGNDTVYGSTAADVIIGNSGSDYLYGNAGDDTFVIEGSDSGFDRVNGGDGQDAVMGSSGDDRFRFSSFSGANTVELIDGISGHDIIEGSTANNTLDFRLTTLNNIARIEADKGNDTVYGSSGDDEIVGGDGSDYLYGVEGDDTFVINDTDTGYNRYNGGDGYDKVIGTVLDDEIRISSFSGANTVELIDGQGGTNRIVGSTANNTLNFSATQLVSITAIDAEAGNDTVTGTSAPDVIIGGLGSDYLYGGDGDDTFVVTHGDTGFDRYNGGDGQDRVEGTDADDVIFISSFSGTNTVEIIDGGNGTNRIEGSKANNTLDFSATQLVNITAIDAGEGNDTLHGTSQADTLIGGLGSDYLYGHNGDDVFVFTVGDTGFDRYNGGDGDDRVEGTDSDDDIRISSFSGSNTVEVIDGKAGNNRIVGSTANNTLDFRATQLLNIAVIDADSGNDTVYGSDDDDVIIGGLGSDYLYGEAGDDRFEVTQGDTGFDRYNGGDGIDRVQAGDNDDTLRISSFSGAHTVEIIDGGSGVNRIVGSTANNTLNFTDTQLLNIAEIDADKGNDTVYGSAQNDVLIGGLGSDYLYGNAGDDLFKVTEGDTGFDRYNGGEGNDRLKGTASDDTIQVSSFSGAHTVEVIDGLSGNNRIVGSSANNTLDFSATSLVAITQIDAGNGNDTVKGSDGADEIVGGLGSDYLYGNGGDDRFIVTSGDTGYDRYNGGDGNDQVVAGDGDDTIRISSFSGEHRVEIIDGGAGVNHIVGSSANNTLTFTDTQLINIALIDAQAGNDTVYGSAANDVIEGGVGSDYLYGNAGDDTFVITVGDTGYDRFSGGEGSDQVLGTSGDDVIRLSSFSGSFTVEEINGNGGDDMIQGTTGNNTLDFSGTQLSGIALIDASRGNDTLTGSAANDVLQGGEGNDTVIGGAGSDTYRFERGHGVDSIRDQGNAADSDTLQLGSGIAIEDVWLVKNGNHLDVYLLGGADKISITNWFTDDSNHIERISLVSGENLTLDKVNDLATLMTGIGTPAAGVITLTAEQQSDVASARASAWQ